MIQLFQWSNWVEASWHCWPWPSIPKVRVAIHLASLAHVYRRTEELIIHREKMWWTFLLKSYNDNAGIIRNLRCVFSFVYLNKNDVHPCRVCVATTIRVCHRRVSILRSFWLKPKWTTLPSAPSVRHFSVNSPLLPFFLLVGLGFFGRSRWPATSRWHVRLNAGLCAGKTK